jgi:hypothetical protein
VSILQFGKKANLGKTNFFSKPSSYETFLLLDTLNSYGGVVLFLVIINARFFFILRPLQSKSNPQYVNKGKRGLIFADKGRAKNQ